MLNPALYWSLSYCIFEQCKIMNSLSCSSQYIIFTRFSPTLIHFSLFPKNIFFSLILDFIKLLCTHDFSRVTFATELSTNLVYKSFFVIDYNYISINLLFFFTVKLSIFSQLCVKHKRVMNRSTHCDIEIIHWLKKNCAGIGSVSADTQNFWYRIGIGSEKVVSSHPQSIQYKF